MLKKSSPQKNFLKKKFIKKISRKNYHEKNFPKKISPKKFPKLNFLKKFPEKKIPEQNFPQKIFPEEKKKFAGKKWARMAPPFAAEGCSPPKELEKSHPQGGNFSSTIEHWRRCNHQSKFTFIEIIAISILLKKNNLTSNVLFQQSSLLGRDWPFLIVLGPDQGHLT